MIEWVRPLLSIIGYIAVILLTFQGLIDPAAFFGLATGTIVWWFKSRDEEKKNGGA